MQRRTSSAASWASSNEILEVRLARRYGAI